MSNNQNMHKAKTEKNDEFYTRMEDITQEVLKYEKCFKGKKFCVTAMIRLKVTFSNSSPCSLNSWG